MVSFSSVVESDKLIVPVSAAVGTGGLAVAMIGDYWATLLKATRHT
jgi:hypothetical protein